ncbi:MAG: DUF177 domain-containing protein [Prolixibacteraceae bacterium]|nr:DUF177 domain-containing protein [Prolixibacteraceae bacterium]MBT7393913.1 DUF177 domain-containing protein [Prolixibacteraceae bacterium]
MQHFFQTVSWKSKYNIEFKGLTEGQHDFEFEVDDTFFAHFEKSLMDNGDVTIKVMLEKRSAFIKLHFKIKGWIELTCDRCLDSYQQKVKYKTEIFIKFGEREFEEGENIIWVSTEEHDINLVQLIYEFIILSVPLKHIHPKNKDGDRDCNKKMLEKLKKYTQSENVEGDLTDPRWDALKSLNNN